MVLLQQKHHVQRGIWVCARTVSYIPKELSSFYLLQILVDLFNVSVVCTHLTDVLYRVTLNLIEYTR